MIRTLPGMNGSPTFAWKDPNADEMKILAASIGALLQQLTLGPDGAVVTGPEETAQLASLATAGVAESARRGVPIGAILQGLVALLFDEAKAGAEIEAKGKQPTVAQMAALAVMTVKRMSEVIPVLAPKEAARLASFMTQCDRAALIAITATMHNILISACTCGGLVRAQNAQPCPTCQAAEIRDVIARATGQILTPTGKVLT